MAIASERASCAAPAGAQADERRGHPAEQAERRHRRRPNRSHHPASGDADEGQADARGEAVGVEADAGAGRGGGRSSTPQPAGDGDEHAEADAGPEERADERRAFTTPTTRPALSSRWSSKPCSRSLVRRRSVRCGWGSARPSGPATKMRLSCTSAPFQPATSQTSVTTRRPLRSRPRWTKKSTASEISSAAIENSTASEPWATYWASFFHADSAEWWWTVDRLGWPCCIASSISRAASPSRTSPTISQCGLNRRAWRTSSRWSISPTPSMFASRVSHSSTELGTARVGAEVELAGVLDDDDAGVDRQHVGHRPHERRLAGAGLARR